MSLHTSLESSLSSSKNVKDASLKAVVAKQRYDLETYKSLISHLLLIKCDRTNIVNINQLVNRLNAFDITRSHSTINVSTALHRPSANAATQPIFRPLMQTFQTSATKQASRDSSTIDFFFLPQMPMEESSSHFNIRVPILPDTEIPHHTARTPEILDSAIASPEIMVVAHHPEVVIAAAMTEVVGNAGVEEDIEVLSRAAEFKQAWRDSSSSLKESSSTLKQLWNGVIDDVFGPKRGAPVIA